MYSRMNIHIYVDSVVNNELQMVENMNNCTPIRIESTPLSDRVKEQCEANIPNEELKCI